MKKLLLALVALLPLTANAQLYPLFGPSTGIMKGDPTTPQTSSAVSSDVIGLFSGTCDATHFLAGNGSCSIPAGTGVSSITVPAPLTATGCTGGACAITWTGAQTANQFLATPNGSTGAVSLRAIVGADVPAINLAASGNGGVTGTLGVTNGGSGLNTSTLGDLRYGSGTNTIAALAGNTTTTNKFLTQTGTGTVSAAPAWNTIASGDVPPINLGSTANGGVASASILLGTNGGTSNGFFSVTGPATSLKTFTFPNASATVLTTNAAVTVAQGGTGVGTLTGIVKGNGTSAFTAAASSDVISLWTGTCNNTTYLRGDGACASSTSTPPAGSNTQVQYNNSGAFGADAGLTWNSSNTQLFLQNSATNFNPLTYCANGRTSGERCWSYRVGSSGDLALDVADDAGVPNGTHAALDFGRTGSAITSITIGNPTDNAAASVPGGIVLSGARPTYSPSTSAVAIGATSGGLAQLSMTDGAGGVDSKAWDIFTDGTNWNMRLINDANNASTTWLQVVRSGMSVTDIKGPGGVTMLPAAGTFTGTLTGVSGTVTGTLNYTRIGTLSCIYATADLTGTSNANTMTITGSPSIVNPSGNRVVSVGNMQDNGVGNQIVGQATISSGGTITLAKLNSTPQASSSNWTASGSKGVNAGWTMCFPNN